MSSNLLDLSSYRDDASHISIKSSNISLNSEHHHTTNDDFLLIKTMDADSVVGGSALLLAPQNDSNFVFLPGQSRLQSLQAR